MRSMRLVVVAAVCLGITAPGVGWAEPAHWVADPYAPHHTSGNTLRFGSAIGFLYGEGIAVTALGATAAFGHRFGRLTVEAEFNYLQLQSRGTGQRIGDGERLGVVGRLEVLRLGSEWVGANSMLAIYAEGGAAVAWNHWDSPASQMRVPDDTKRVEGQFGFGILLDHRLEQPIGFPHRVGWFLGWRLAALPATLEATPVCRTQGSSCRVVSPLPPAERDRDLVRSMLFQSSLAMTW